MTDDTDDTAPDEPPRKPRGRRIGLAGIALVIAIVALALAAWSSWRLQHALRAADAMRNAATTRIDAVAGDLATSSRQAQATSQHLDTLQTRIGDVRSSVQGLDLRIANLESAITNLSGQQQSGRDTLLLNDAEMLLRTGQQRYELFNDSTGALKAYAQAIDVLAQVQNPAYAPVRTSAVTERDALAAAVPPSRQAALDTLSELRGKAATLPLASSAPAAPASAATTSPGFWSRIARSFSGIVRVSRDHGGATPPANARFARQMLALDLAQAQEALLAFDDAAFRESLERADATLAAHFDSSNADVQGVRNRIATMLARPNSGTPPKLGGTLAQLRSVRASQPVATPPPAPAATIGNGGSLP